MASFQAKIGWERPRKIEKKKNRSDESLTDPKQGNKKKLQKIKKHHYGFFSSQNRLGIAWKERK